MPVSVVDASALAALAFNEAEAAAVSDMLSGKQLVAPALVIYELGNTCWKKCRRYPASASAFRKSFTAALSLPIELFVVEPTKVLATAEDTGASFYDAAYIWLSRCLNAPLVTLDRQLRKIAGTVSPS
jgi:predicted nucleic acid-binding protein